jgi:hypothetical protein
MGHDGVASLSLSSARKRLRSRYRSCYFGGVHNFGWPGSRWQVRPGFLGGRASRRATSQKLVNRRKKDETPGTNFDRRDPTFGEQPVNGRARQVQRMGRLKDGIDPPLLGALDSFVRH